MKARLARTDGFTTVAIMITLMLASLLVAAAFATANGGTPLARTDQNDKEAYSAAEAGVAFYAYHLAQDPNYWTYCTNPPSPATPNPLWDGVAGDPRAYRPLPSPTAATDQGAPPSYSIELVAAPGAVKCTDGLASTTYLNTQNGTFSIRSTGLYRGRRRTIFATFKRRGFVDFLWFTNFETPDPLSYPQNLQNSATANCQKFRRDGRVVGSTQPCWDQEFVGGDRMAGPMHTNDRFYTCGSPYFGGTANDRIESVDPDEFETGCGPAAPAGAGTLIAGAQPLDFPLSNSDLASDTLTGWTFQGKTDLNFLTNGNVIITNAGFHGGTPTTSALPPNNVIYIHSQGCGSTYNEAQQYVYTAVNKGCGDVFVHGTYPHSLTIGADNDIIVSGNLLRGDPQAEMGLIANGFIRVYHPINFGGSSECDDTDHDAAGAMHDVEIDAAMLSLHHSFLVDNAKCGDPEGTLTVDGAIAQWFRGTVGTHDNNGNTDTGYLKNYIYDQHLKYADPPYFLDPVETSWDIVRETEQVPAT